ncbi:MAG: Omp28-related outer membrane protein [Chitinophagales bacterium]|nr:Omp28-related outer membrane protein [Chitinophagales bacterium]
MNKSIFILLFTLLSGSLFAQTSAKKYVMIEHFTNSNCGICAIRNPAFFNLITQYPDDVHHLSVHPQFPYSSCVFYQANTSENNARTNYYSVSGTPQIAINGALQNASSPLLSAAKLNTFLNQTSPVRVEVSETTGANRNVTVKVHILGDVPAGTYKLYLAVAEKVINQTTGNGESVHRNVFRDMITNINGDNISIPPAGQTVTANYQYSVGNYQADQLYVLAWVQNADDKTILNSGTRFDAAVSGTNDPGQVQNLRIFPNPVADQAYVQLNDDQVARWEIYCLDGRLLQFSTAPLQSAAAEVPTADLLPGIYTLRVIGEKGIYLGKFVK